MRHLGPSRRAQPMGWMDWPPFEGTTPLEAIADKLNRQQAAKVQAWQPREDACTATRRALASDRPQPPRKQQSR